VTSMASKGRKSKRPADNDDDDGNDLDSMLEELMMQSHMDGLEEATQADEAMKEANKQLELDRIALASASPSTACVTYRCRHCARRLFTSADEVEHADDEVSGTNSGDHGDDAGADAGEGEGALPIPRPLPACDLVFIRQLDWLSVSEAQQSQTATAIASVSVSASSVSIDLRCPKCSSNIGRLSMAGPHQCACGRVGGGQAPFIGVKLSRVDVENLTTATAIGPRCIDAEALDRAREAEAREEELRRAKAKERLNEKRKAKNASKMPVTKQTGNFSEFRNKSMRPAAGKKQKNKKKKGEEDED